MDPFRSRFALRRELLRKSQNKWQKAAKNGPVGLQSRRTTFKISRVEVLADKRLAFPTATDFGENGSCDRNGIAQIAPFADLRLNAAWSG